MSEKEKTVQFIDFFNVRSSSHCNAYLKLVTEGAWPQGFIPENVIDVAEGIRLIESKMAREWAEEIEFLDND